MIRTSKPAALGAIRRWHGPISSPFPCGLMVLRTTCRRSKYARRRVRLIRRTNRLSHVIAIDYSDLLSHHAPKYALSVTSRLKRFQLRFRPESPPSSTSAAVARRAVIHAQLSFVATTGVPSKGHQTRQPRTAARKSIVPLADTGPGIALRTRVMDCIVQDTRPTVCASG